VGRTLDCLHSLGFDVFCDRNRYQVHAYVAGDGISFLTSITHLGAIPITAKGHFIFPNSSQRNLECRAVWHAEVGNRIGRGVFGRTHGP
jgi:hypothetical protein